MKGRILVALVAVLALAGCTSTTSNLPVRTDYSKTTAFQEWKNFRFASDSTRSDYQRYPRFERMAQQALETELTDRGYTRLAEGSPDFRVSFDLIFRGSKKSQAALEDRGAEPKATAYGGSSQRGTLIVKMHDPVSAEILWTGQISEIKMNVIEPQKELDKAVRRLLMEFPPLTR
ncbi:DUF4136 domain-containing protein [Acidobacteriota bacterium]